MMEASHAATCVANIGPLQRRRRLVIGVAGVVLSTVLSVVLVSPEFPRAARISLFIPWFVSALGLFQAKAQTCVALAARGQRDLDRGSEAIPHHELEAVKRQARSVYVRSFAAALMLTALVVLLPGD